VNIYNALPNSTRGEQAVRSLTSLPHSFFPRLTFVARDLNLHHHLWQPSYEYSTASAAPFVSWTDSLHLILTSCANEPTQDQGNVLDLAFSTSALESLRITTELSEDLETSSDHRTLLSTVYWDPRYREPPTTLRLPTLDKEVFLRSLTKYLEPLQLLDTLQTPVALDKLALELTTQIQKAFAKSAKRTYPCSIGNPWWTAECSKAANEYRQARRLSNNPLEARRALRNAVRRAKGLFYREMLNTATSNNVFKIAKWHTSTGSYRTPPLQDPTQPDAPPAVLPHEKRDVLARNLLRNAAKAGDIPLTSPAIPRASLPFPDLTDHEIEISILGAGNTVLRLAWPLIYPFVTALFRYCL
jgi:hypothetical protein